MAFLHELLTTVVNAAILLFEFVGVIILISAGLKGIVDYLRRDSLTALNLAKGMAMGLEFKLGSEILRTVIVTDLSEILTVAFIVALRAALTFLIHWEIRSQEAATESLPKKEEIPPQEEGTQK